MVSVRNRTPDEELAAMVRDSVMYTGIERELAEELIAERTVLADLRQRCGELAHKLRIADEFHYGDTPTAAAVADELADMAKGKE